MSSPSIAKSAQAYIATRLARGRVATLVLFVVVAAIAVTGETDVSEAIIVVVIATLLVLLFRVWDDLADVEFDRKRCTDRILVTISDRRSFGWTVVAGLLIVAVLLSAWRTVPQVVAYLILVAAMSASYRVVLPRIARIHVVLLKYPVFIYLCSPAPRSVTALIIGSGAYLVLAIYELFSDSTLRQWSGRRWLLPAEVLALIVVTGAILWARQ